MSDTILDLVSSYTSPGCQVNLTLLSQEKVNGVISTINSSALVLQQDNGNVRIIRAQNIVDFEIIEATSVKNATEKPKNQKLVQAVSNDVNTEEKIIPISDDSVRNSPDFPANPPQNSTKLSTASPTNPISVSRPSISESPDDPNEILFKANINLSPIEPNFIINDISFELKQELNKIKNKYEYATKVQELSRIRSSIHELEEIAATANNHKIYLLCGQMARIVNDKNKALRYFQIALSQNNGQAGVMLALDAIENNKWSEAATFLVHSLLSEQKDNLWLDQLLIALGTCLYRTENKELQGLGQTQGVISSPSEKELYFSVIALALRDKYPEASKLALKGDIFGASKIAIESPVFSPALPFRSKYSTAHKSNNKSSASKDIYGRISAYYTQRMYGFIVSTGNVTYYFHQSDIKDTPLRDSLYKDIINQNVSFRVTPRTPGHKYAQALEIRSLDICTNSVNISSSQAQIPLPSKDSTYQRAKIAEQNRDFNKAQKLYQVVIDNMGEYSNSAIKDYASLLNRLDKPKEAISLLDKYSSRFDEPISLKKMKVMFFIKAGEYGAASQLLEILTKNAVTKQQKSNWLRQLAYCLFMDNKVEESLFLLRENVKIFPKDALLRDLLEKFENTKLTGRSGEIEELQGLAGISSGLSKFSKYLIRNCDFPGADERAKARGFFNKRDFKEIKKLFDRIDGRRPKEKANLLITLAAMTEKSPEFAANENPNQILARAFSFMGEAATYEEIDKDSIRFYLIESMRLGSTREGFDTRFPLSFFLASYLSLTPSPGELLDGRRYDVEGTLQKLISDQRAIALLTSHLSYFDLMTPSAVDLLISIAKNENLSLFDSTVLNNRIKFKQDMRARVQKEENTFLALQKNEYRTKAIFKETSTILFSLIDKTLFEFDKYRISNLSSIILECEKYWEEHDYIERESKSNRIKASISTFVHDINSRPTKLSFEQLLHLAEKVGKAIESDFAEFKLTTKPDLRLVNILSDDYYVPDRENIITLHLELSASQSSAPVEGIEIKIHEDKGLKLIVPAYSPEILKGGQRREVILKVKPSREQLIQEAFTIRPYISYKNRSGKSEKSSDFSFAIRLGYFSDFVPIPNPYQNYAGGRSVEDPEMFKGRDDVIERILKVVGSGPIGECFVLYGQKRSGKTSILNQLKSRLPNSCLPISLSLGEVDIDPDKKNINFIDLCIEKLSETLEDKYDYIPDNFPPRVLVATEPNAALRRSFRETIRIVRSVTGTEPKIVLLVDEFTYIFEYITEGSLSPDFMRTWKALLQAGMFSAVVVGQDSMPLFKQAFPNEFGVTHDERISYLSRHETHRLSTEPILLKGKSRFRGNAQERLFELSAGSPFYTNIICDRLVNFLNFRHAPFITEADIESILFGWRGGNEEFSGLIVGSESIPLERFDPLITAAADSVAPIKRDDYLKVLIAIAKSSEKRALFSDLPQLPNLSYILKDLNDREIVCIDSASRYSIRVGLFAEWLNINAVFSGVHGEEQY